VREGGSAPAAVVSVGGRREVLGAVATHHMQLGTHLMRGSVRERECVCVSVSVSESDIERVCVCEREKEHIP